MPFVLPDPTRKARLSDIQKWLMQHKEEGSLDALARAVNLMLEEETFRSHVARTPSLKEGVKTPDDLMKYAWGFLYDLLYRRDMVSAAMTLWDRETFCAEPYQVQMIWNALISNRMICIMGGGGLGKCLGPEVGVLMFDGSVKPAKEVKVGDVLMGDDGTPRNVLHANPGHGPMYRVTPQRGEPWTCNDAHILTLRAAYDKKCGCGAVSKNRAKGTVLDVPISEYIGWSKNKKAQFLQFHTGVSFSDKTLPYDPYIYGVWLGDGGWDTPAIHKPKGPITERWCEYFSSLGYTMVVSSEDRCPMFAARNGAGKPHPFLNFIRTSVRDKEKFIRQDYLVNSRENRLKLLAGLIDTDGNINGTSYELTSKWKGFASQVCWLARSLGFAATMRPRKGVIKSIGFEGIYWYVYISGHGLTEIPTLQKKVPDTNSIKSMTNTAFSVEAIGDGDYYGFVIDGNHRFLLGDFTVTHNTMNTTALYMLEYVFDPQWTRIQLASASESHLLGNMFADAVRLHSGASMKLPGRQDTESISLDKKTAQGIFTMTLPGGASGKSKIKGSHTKSRGMHGHPLFGRRSRVFGLIDECQEVPPNVFDEIPNRFSSISDDDVDHIKFVICANPRDIFSRFAKCAEPVGGWAKIGKDDEQWVSRMGWTVLSLDQRKHENYVQRRVVYPGFATYAGFHTILKSCDGDPEHPRMYTLCYGKFPPQGTTFACIKQKHLVASEGEWLFSGPTTAIGGCDPAYSADRPALALGRAGMASGWRDAEGKEHVLEKPKMAIQIDVLVILSHGDAQEVADEAMFRLKEAGVHFSNFAVDQTGSGRGVADNARHQWAQKVSGLGLQPGEKAAIIGVEYATTASRLKIAEEDTQLPSERFDRTATELWYAGAAFWELDVIRVGNGVELEAMAELAGRKGDMQPGLGKKLTIETKLAYKQRTGARSPDLADAILLLIHAARMSIPGITPKAKDTVIPPPKRDLFNWNARQNPEFNQAIPAIAFGNDSLSVTTKYDLQRD